jgi:hypothetical protein
MNSLSRSSLHFTTIICLTELSSKKIAAMKLGLAHGAGHSLGLDPSHCLVRDHDLRRIHRLGS